MVDRNSLEENFRFLLLEVEHQVKLTFGLLNESSTRQVDRIVTRDDYIDNLKASIENDCFSRLHRSPERRADESNYIRAVHTICINLERIADFCVNIARQTEYFMAFDMVHQLNYTQMFAEIQQSLTQIQPVLRARDLQGAVGICRAEKTLDEMYKEAFGWVMARMRQGQFTEDLVTTLFIFRYLERIGDALLNIGEALVFSILGEQVKIEQLDALQHNLSHSELHTSLAQVELHTIRGSRSGCRIALVKTHDKPGPPDQGIFKEGSKDKIVKEKKNIERWEAIMPGLVPKVYDYQENKENASLLVEFLPGQTLDAVALQADAGMIHRVMGVLEETLGRIWRQTRTDGALRTDYMQQLSTRLESVQRVHPAFVFPGRQIHTVSVSSTEELIRRCARIEQNHPAPFGVLTHGDFNVNNVVYNSENGKLNFVDLYRSATADYLQDVSVFLVSNFRLPVFDPQMRQRLNRIIERFAAFASGFALQQTDQTFTLRLALALARSFFTSTRFELNRPFAGDMVQRAHYLMERVAFYKGDGKNFKFPLEILFY